MPFALVFTGPRALELREEPSRAPGPGEVRLQTLYSGISHGTEMNVYRGVAPQYQKSFDPKVRLFLPAETPHWRYPTRYGYAAVSRVLDTGPDVTRVQAGDIVFSHTHHRTETTTKVEAVHRLPSGIDPLIGIFVANLNTSLNGVLDADIHVGDTVVILGQGVLGLLALQWVRLSGARQIVVADLAQHRRELGREMGATVALDPAEVDVALEVRRLTDNRGADVTFDLTGSYRGLQTAIRTAAPDTAVIAMSWYPGQAAGLVLGDEFHHNRITLRCSQVGQINPHLRHRWSIARRMETVMQYLPQLRLRPLISDVMPFQDAAEAYRRVDSGADGVTQVVLDYTTM